MKHLIRKKNKHLIKYRDIPEVVYSWKHQTSLKYTGNQKDVLSFLS